MFIKILKLSGIIAFIFTILTKPVSYSQTIINCTLYTPEGRAFTAYREEPDFTSGEMAALDLFIDTAYIRDYQLNAVKVGNASRLYSCHGYAWSVSEGGMQANISMPTTIYAADEAWSNDDLPSYIQASEAEATLNCTPKSRHKVKQLLN